MKPWLCTAGIRAVLGALCQPGPEEDGCTHGSHGREIPIVLSTEHTRGPMGQFSFIAQLDISPSSCCFPNLYYYALMLQEKGASG